MFEIFKIGTDRFIVKKKCSEKTPSFKENVKYIRTILYKEYEEIYNKLDKDSTYAVIDFDEIIKFLRNKYKDFPDMKFTYQIVRLLSYRLPFKNLLRRPFSIMIDKGKIRMSYKIRTLFSWASYLLLLVLTLIGILLALYLVHLMFMVLSSIPNNF